MTLRRVVIGKQDRWTKEEILQGVKNFVETYKRFPKAHEFDSCDYLPTARSVQRSFGGLTGLKAEFGFIEDYHKGEYRANIARSINKRSLGIEKRLGLLLEKQFGKICVHRERAISFDSKERLDFVVFHRGGEFGIDVFYAETLKNLQKCINIKQKKYQNYNEPLFFVSANSDISVCEVNEMTGNKIIPMNRNVRLVTEGDFLTIVGDYKPLTVS